MKKNLIFNKDLVFLNIEANNKMDALDNVSDKMIKLGFVKDSFKEALKKRELSFPTGLPVEVGAVAVPHTDAEHINDQCIAVAVLKSPVKFQIMGAENEDCDVDILFVLGLTDPKEQLGALQAIIGIIQQSELLASIRKSKNEVEVAELILAELKK